MLKKSPFAVHLNSQGTIFRSSGSPMAANNENKLQHLCLTGSSMYVCLCVHASVCVSFTLNSTNCIPYSAIYDALMKSKTKHYSRNHFFPMRKSRSLLGSVSWCRRGKAQDLWNLLWTQDDEHSMMKPVWLYYPMYILNLWCLRTGLWQYDLFRVIGSVQKI